MIAACSPWGSTGLGWGRGVRPRGSGPNRFGPLVPGINPHAMMATACPRYGIPFISIHQPDALMSCHRLTCTMTLAIIPAHPKMKTEMAMMVAMMGCWCWSVHPSGRASIICQTKSETANSAPIKVQNVFLGTRLSFSVLRKSIKKTAAKLRTATAKAPISSSQPAPRAWNCIPNMPTSKHITNPK